MIVDRRILASLDAGHVYTVNLFGGKTGKSYLRNS